MRVVVYRVTGRQGWLRVPEWVCPDCDLTVAATRSALREAGVADTAVEVRPWLSCLWQALRQGAWHPPAVVADGVVLSQGRVPDVPTLAARLGERANATRWAG